MDKKLTKEEALVKIEELKQYVTDEDKKDEDKVKFQIKTFGGTVLFESTKTTQREAILDAVASDADLCGADLSGAELQNAKFYGKGGIKPLKRTQLPDFLMALGFIIED